ncbi:major facilitator superfamily domain-containing protein [Dissophora ornata]|nr:major facilitator superfamily domain-containing protein [Dissophora ornata]
MTLSSNNHHLHHDRPESKANSIISEKFLPEKQGRSSTDLDDNKTVNGEKGLDIQSTDPVMEGKLLDYPEGGFGWLVVLSSFVVNFWAFGSNTTFGIYQAYFLKANTFPGAVATDISWVGSIATAAMYVPGPFVASMIRFLGLRVVVASGIILAASGFIGASFATQLWHLYLTQGLLFGTGAGLVFFSSMPVAAQYFERRRGLANGIAVAGSGIGGLALAPLTRLLIAQVGVRWCQRIIGFAIFGFMTSICTFIRPRVKTFKSGPIFDFGLFKVHGFVWLLLTQLVVAFGYMVPVFLIPTYSSVHLGQSATTGANLISIYSGINAVSRVGLGVAADKVGRTNILLSCCFFAGLSCLTLWSQASNIGILTGFMVVYGVFEGGFISIFPVVAAQVVGVERLPSALGILYFGNAVGNLLGSPIATAIMRAHGGQYIGAIMFAGFAPLLATFFVLFIRFRISKKLIAVA